MIRQIFSLVSPAKTTNRISPKVALQCLQPAENIRAGMAVFGADTGQVCICEAREIPVSLQHVLRRFSVPVGDVDFLGAAAEFAIGSSGVCFGAGCGAAASLAKLSRHPTAGTEKAFQKGG